MGHKTSDATLAFFINQLTALDTTMHEPLASVTWSRDIMLREGVSFSNESSSFMRQTYGAIGGMTAGGKNWLAGNGTTIPGIDVNGELITAPLRLWGQELSYTSVELERSQNIGQSLDTMKMKGITLKYNMDIDEMVYVGDTDLGVKGLCNSVEVTAANAVNGAAASPLWSTKTPDEILKDFDTALNASWLASGYAVCPSDCLLPPLQYAQLVSMKIGTSGSVSVLKYLEDNCISLKVNGKPLNIRPVKWLNDAGVGSTARAVFYTNDLQKVRYPLVPIRRETAYYQGIRFAVPYISLFGQVEFVYPETVRYMDGI